eukprot:TRINITY_DN12090_c0_g1_i1.p1 TRINITY_DN12090_c0_g1~~TRINITY_DN12090_c0_g1_i1.p1  ORF type:complete len:140 (+),score=10.75 TRINITY_DN12090_c0_g1_i1:40-459(+)
MLAHEVLIPSRFLCLIGHFITIVMIFQTRSENVASTLAGGVTDPDYSSSDKSCLAALILSLIGIVIQFAGLVGGFTMFQSFINFININVNFVATVLLCFFITDVWGYTGLWWIFGFLNAPFAFLELMIIIIRIARLNSE